ncbi:hypothetical protein BDDG_06285 [Blastomyces dermatitidis ATCC 18188]|uniref:Uncharacterized protein n=1 Tax=Ajellomyces dermatitidis (strain ATCC 18188 / CBS 674.68) TaxID=653446 RepID=F2TJC8_AJEDA|nr:hypothetical protein BDDG_06285 [Blastomyces dermatitidis ATCC 18188]
MAKVASRAQFRGDVPQFSSAQAMKSGCSEPPTLLVKERGAGLQEDITAPLIPFFTKSTFQRENHGPKDVWLEHLPPAQLILALLLINMILTLGRIRRAGRRTPKALMSSPCDMLKDDAFLAPRYLLATRHDTVFLPSSFRPRSGPLHKRVSLPGLTSKFQLPTAKFTCA